MSSVRHYYFSMRRDESMRDTPSIYGYHCGTKPGGNFNSAENKNAPAAFLQWVRFDLNQHYVLLALLVIGFGRHFVQDLFRGAPPERQAFVDRSANDFQVHTVIFRR